MKKYFEVNNFVKNIFIPIAILILYSLSFSYLVPTYLPEGVNNYFVSNLWKYGFIVLVVLYLLFFILYKVKNEINPVLTNPIEKEVFSNSIFILLPLTTVIQYVIINLGTITPLDSLIIIAFFVIFFSFYILAVPITLGIFSSNRILTVLGLAFVFTITNMASISNYFKWYKTGNWIIQIIYFGLIFVAAWILLSLKDKKLVNLVIMLYFVFSMSYQMILRTQSTDTSKAVSETKLIVEKGKKPNITPDVYLLVYDAYIPNETMLNYKIDNSVQENFLKTQNFVLYPHTYSIAAGTLRTMSRVLHLLNPENETLRTGVSGDGIVQNTFKDIGYKTFGIFPYLHMFNGIGSTYDYSIPKNDISYSPLIKSILIGEFRFNIGFDALPYSQFLASKKKIFETDAGEKVFLYTHSKYPAHTQNSGVCLKDEIPQYKKRLNLANIEMTQDVNAIIKNDPKAIIIVAGDHGPYITKNCTALDKYKTSTISRIDIQDRFATFLAIRWPTSEYKKYDDITVLQDVFPAILAYMYEDPNILKSKIPPNIIEKTTIGGATVKNGIIYGGINDGEPLFLSNK